MSYVEEEDTVNIITYIFVTVFIFMHSVSIFVTLETN